MSEDGGQADMGGGHSPATDPRGTIASSQLPDNWHPAGLPALRNQDLSDEEKRYHRRVFGVTYRERNGPPAAVCVSFCLTPGQRRKGIRCPCCYGPVEIRPMDGSEVEPGIGRAERFAAWVGGWFGAFCDALLFPFRVGRAHTEAVIRDILQEAMGDALSDILTVLESSEGELRAIRNAAEAGE